jgi:hypothetical protein
VRPKPSAALTVPKVVSRLEISSAVIDGVRPEIMSLLVMGVSRGLGSIVVCLHFGSTVY